MSKFAGKINIDYEAAIGGGINLNQEMVDYLVQRCFDEDMEFLDVDNNGTPIKVTCDQKEGNVVHFRILFQKK
ncbi:hypothetical protein ACFL1Y_00140 [Patescibacteria group bacterium]